MRVRAVHDRDELAALLGRDPARHAYELGDLDDFFWPYTTWYRLGDLVALVYHGSDVPTLLAFAGSEDSVALGGLAAAVAPLLPRRVHAHLSPGAVAALRGAGFQVGVPALYRRLALTDVSRLPDGLSSQVCVLTGADLPELLGLYEAAYPGNWFDARMLDTGQYVGVRRGGLLLAVAGVHVWSPRYRVAALGNVTTHPVARGEGLARAAVGALCVRLRGSVDHIALNVGVDNSAALRLYEGLGFTLVAEFVEVGVSAG